MPLIQDTPDALPYIDAQPSQDALSAADALITKELRSHNTTDLHSSMLVARQSAFSPLLETAFAQIEAGNTRPTGIDLTRYEVLDAPEKSDVDEWRLTLQKAYASYEYLRGRELNLALLETYGKNAWLIGNSQLEDILRDLERDVSAAKTDLEAIDNERRYAQGNAAAEMQNLNDTWRQGIGRMIEAQVAGERLRLDILDRRRHGASS